MDTSQLLLLILVVVVLGGGVAFLVVGRRRGGGAEPGPGGTLLEGRRGEPEVPAERAPRCSTNRRPRCWRSPSAVVEEPPVPPVAEPEVRPTFRERLSRARSTMSGYLSSVLSRKEISEESYEELEEALLLADVGMGPTQELLDGLRATAREQRLTTNEELLDALRAEMKSTLEADPGLARSVEPPTIWLFVGVNGVGKTTTIGKVGHRLAAEGSDVVMAAGDTFRAAAAEQLETWADRCGAHLVRGAEGSDPSSVIFDAVEAAASRGADVVLADTAGRLHTKTNLMDELSKVRRVADKGAGSVTEVLLVLDATTGQNGLAQARQFADATDVTGVVLTKLDGSAKGGIVFAIRSELGLPVKLVGLGETASDLVDFDAGEFVDALVSTD
ncbi:MAG: signal recognition particle-docking protein FtsY [Microthrixaceae bacterium]